MSKETLEWLNNNTLIGFTEKRGNAWHYRASDQGTESNHYIGAVPVADVLRRLFHWQAIEVPVFVSVPADIETATGIDSEGNGFRMVPLVDRKAIARNDSYEILGLFKSGYNPHQYETWLLDNVANILDDSLAIGSAGLLRNGAQAWVSVEVPDSVTTPEGFEFRPNLLACTSFDGSLATTYKRVVTAVVCDNTLSAGLGESGQVMKVKHSKHSGMKIADARDALAIIHTMSDDFASEIARLTQWEVTDKAWDSLLDRLVPIDESNKRSVTVGDKKRDELNSLYRFDSRCAPWVGTALGVLQAWNTYAHHVTPTRGNTLRAERNMVDVLTDKMAKNDESVLNALALVTA